MTPDTVRRSVQVLVRSRKRSRGDLGVRSNRGEECNEQGKRDAPP